MTLNSELFVQSDRLAAFAITGSQRYLLFSVVGVTFPFLIVSTTTSLITSGCQLCSDV